MGLDVISWVLLLRLLTVAMARNLRDADDICSSYYHDGRTHVDCSNLCLTEIPPGLNYQAQVLHLSGNSFVSFPTGLEYFTRVEELDISDNHMSGRIPTFVENWTNIHTLNLSNNNYETWESINLGSSLIKLDLSKNKINVIDEDAFTGMYSLHSLDLSENRINELSPRLFSDTGNLDNLILARNYVSAIPSFRSSSLRSLDLSNCQVSSLEVDSLSRLTSLLEINLSMNQIESIPDYFTSHTLQELDLSYNGIGSLTDNSFSSLPHLAVLDLRGNNFKDIWSTSTFSSNPFLREVRVKGNRWSCEGFSVNLLLTYEYLTRDPQKVTDRTSLICYYPSNVTQLSWQEAYIQTWHPNEEFETFTIAAVMIGIIIGVLLTSVVCRALMSINESEPRTAILPASLSGSQETILQPRVESVVVRIPLQEDLPPTYDEALLMPRLNSSFHSLPDFIDEEEDRRRFRRSRSIGDLVESRTRAGDRRSVRPHRTVEISIE